MVVMRHAVPAAQADRLTASAEDRENVRTPAAGFEVARMLAGYWPALGART